MTMKALLTSFLVLLVCTTSLVAQAEPQLKKGDIKKLGKPFASWFDGKLLGDKGFEQSNKAFEDLSKIVVDLEKKLKGVPVLSLVSDWETVLDSYRGFPTKGLKKGKTVLDEIPGGRGAFAKAIPKKYKGKKSWPLLLLLPGDAVGPEAAVQSLPPAILEQCIVIAPDMRDLPPGAALSETKGRLRLLLPLSMASQSLMVDRSRVFLLGLGSAASDASVLAAAQPGTFAGYAWSGGSPAADLPEGNLALITGKEHADIAAASAWLFDLPRRNAYPTELDILYTNDWSKRFYWLWANPDTGVEGKTPRIKVTVDRKTNTIVIDAEDVENVDIFLNDILLDLDQEITIIRNGEPVKFRAYRSLGTLLDKYFLKTLDSSSIYTALIRTVSIPVAKE